MEQYKLIRQKKWRYGYTTGSCAAAAAKAATSLLLAPAQEAIKGRQGLDNQSMENQGLDNQSLENQVLLRTPSGTELSLTAQDISWGKNWVSCAIRKDSGDDPDITNGILIYAKVEKTTGTTIQIEGGKGVGRVTKPGLNRPVGAAAINEVPLRMIEDNVREVCEHFDYRGGLMVEISVPQGEEIARKTFNPQLGICGGISILGTSGLVEPMSEKALVETIRAELSVLRASGADAVLITPGNYGKDFLLQYGARPAVKCSNFIGDTLDIAQALGFTKVCLVGHIGKLIKLATGNWNTHSQWGDPRREILVTYAALSGVTEPVLVQLLDSVTTEQGIYVLQEVGAWETVLERILCKIAINLQTKWPDADQFNLELILFSKEQGLLGKAGNNGDAERYPFRQPTFFAQDFSAE